jgi:hypothetical protein
VLLSYSGFSKNPAKSTNLRDSFGGLTPMLELASDRESMLNSKKFSLCLYLRLWPIYRLNDLHH